MWGHSQEEHDTRLLAVLQKMENAGVTLNLDKCALSQREVKFLGHIISDSGVQPDPAKTIAVQKMPEPSNISVLRSFLGMVNQLGKCIPHLAEKDKPLRDLLSKKNCWFWGEAQVKAYQDLKKDLSSAPVLALYDANKPIKVSADASLYGLGAVLLQQEGDDWRPVAYASRSLTPVEQRYAQVEKEALGRTWAYERFRDFLICHHFVMETDQKTLTKSSRWQRTGRPTSPHPTLLDEIDALFIQDFSCSWGEPLDCSHSVACSTTCCQREHG